MTVQLTLEGGETDEERVRPKTFLWDPEEEKWILRSKRADVWPRRLYESPDDAPPKEWYNPSAFKPSVTVSDDEDDEPEVVGGVYSIELSYSVDFRFVIPAASEHEAKDRAEDLVDYPSNCTEMFQVHTSTDEIRELLEDDDQIPDGWDPYGRTPLWEVYGSETDDQ